VLHNTDCRVKPNDTKKDGKEVKQSDMVKKIMRAWDVIVKSPKQDLYASALMKFQNVCKDFPNMY